MLKYPRATIASKSGVRNLIARVTVPTELREIVGRKQIERTLGTYDLNVAKQRLTEVEQVIYAMLDSANLADEPLVKAANALQEILKGGVQWEPKHWFDPVVRWQAEDDVRARSGKAMSNFREIEKLEGVSDKVASILANLDHSLTPYEVRQYLREIPNTESIDPGMPSEEKPDLTLDTVEKMFIQIERIIKPRYETFVSEFRKVSKKTYESKERNKLFRLVVEEYHSSPDFKNQVKREKTRDDYIGTCAKFLAWAGDVSLDNFEGHEGRQLAATFVDEMNSPNSMIVQRKRAEIVASGTINRMFAAIRGVLRYAYNQGYTEHRLWDDTQSIVTAKGAKKIKPRPFEPEEEKALMASPMPPRDRLLLQFVITTGARLDEIALLTWGQIKETEVKGEPCWYFILKEDISPVKRLASERVVPIHPTMMECLKPYWKNTPFRCKMEKNRLFNFTKGKDGKTTAASKAGMRHIRKLFSDERLVNHSFRYSYVSRTERIEDAMSPRMANYIQGFALEKSERASYSTGYLVDQLYPAIKLIDFDFILPPKQISKQ